MNRRETLKKISFVLGSAISLPIATGFLAGCKPETSSSKIRLNLLSSEQGKLIEAIAELIIPQTNTPGAKAAGVNQFVETMVFNWFSEHERLVFFQGMSEVEAYCRKINSKNFLQCSEKKQVAILTELEKEFLATRDDSSHKAQFFHNMKQLTLIGFYTSEVGATQELRMPVMGEYLGDIPLEENDAAWAW